MDPPNRPPVVSGLRDTTVSAGGLLIMPFTVHDADGDSITYLNVAVGLSPEEWAVGYVPAAGLIWDELFVWYRPVSGDGDRRWFYVLAEDEHGAEGEAPVQVQIENPASPGIAAVERDDLIFRRFTFRRPRASDEAEQTAGSRTPLEP